MLKAKSLRVPAPDDVTELFFCQPVSMVQSVWGHVHKNLCNRWCPTPFPTPTLLLQGSCPEVPPAALLAAKVGRQQTEQCSCHGLRALLRWVCPRPPAPAGRSSAAQEGIPLGGEHLRPPMGNPTEHRSHFGSRCKLGCCVCASLIFVAGDTTPQLAPQLEQKGARRGLDAA